MSQKFTRVVVEKAAWKSTKTVGKDSGYKRGAYIVSMDRKTTVYRLEVGKITFFEKRVRDVHSNAFPYFTGLPVSSSLYRRYGTRAWLHDTVQASCDTLV